VTRKGIEMIGDLRTDALHEALSRAPIEDDTLMALLVLAFAGQNVSVDSGAGGDIPLRRRRPCPACARAVRCRGQARLRHRDAARRARGVLIDVLSCRENRSNSGIVARVAGDAIGADGFLPNMGTEEFLSCLSRPALEGSCKPTRRCCRAQRVKDTRAALVEHFKEGHFVHPAALFAPDATKPAEWLAKSAVTEGRGRRWRGRARSGVEPAMTADQAAAEDLTDESARATAKPPSSASTLSSIASAAAGPPGGGFVFHSPEWRTPCPHIDLRPRAPRRIVAWSDGTPRPPERHRKKLAAWKDPQQPGASDPQAGPESRAGNIHARMRASPCTRPTMAPAASSPSASTGPFARLNSLRFTIVERPRSARCASSTAPATMPSLCISRRIAPPPSNGCRSTAIPNAVLEEVTADEAAAEPSRGGQRHERDPSNRRSSKPPVFRGFFRPQRRRHARRARRRHAFAMAPGRDGRHYLASGWRIGRPMAEWTRSDFYGHGGELADEAAFRAKVAGTTPSTSARSALGRRDSLPATRLGDRRRAHRLCRGRHLPFDGRPWRLQALGRAQPQGPPDAARRRRLVRRG
jgi:hypothetical protein